MTVVTAPMRKHKSDRRDRIISGIMAALKSSSIYDTIPYQNQKESAIKQYMHRVLIEGLEVLYADLNPDYKIVTVKKKARQALIWEGDKRTTVNNFTFLGVMHRPDFLVKIDGLEIAVEVKRGENGASVREGLGQSVVYAQRYDFVCYIFIDTSRDKRIRESVHDSKEGRLIESLWRDYNIHFDVV